MSKNPKITVITPTYNRANLIKETIESILNQDFKDFEYFILDDGSSDNTREVIEPYLKDKRVKYLYRENTGEAETVNWGWSLANGEYFTQVNSDDPILPGLFSEMVEALDENKDAVLAYPDFYFIDENGEITFANKTYKWNFPKYLSEFSCYAASAGTFIRRSSFANWTKLKDSRFKYINDVHMYWNMALVGDFLHIPKFLATWRAHKESISAERYKSIPEVEIWLKEYFSQPNLPPEIVACQEKTTETIYKYFLKLIKKSRLSLKEKMEWSLPYNKKLGLPTYEFSNLQIGDNDLIGNKFNGHDLHLYLREKNIDSSHLVCKKKSDDENTFFVSYNEKFHNVRTNALEIETSYNTWAMFYPFALDIMNYELFQDTDVVHYHLINNYFFNMNLLPIMTKMKPSVWTIHDPWALTGHCIHTFGCKKWQLHCGDCPHLDTHFAISQDTTALNFELKRQIMQSSKLSLIVASKWMKNYVENSPITKGLPVYLVPFGVNQQLFKPKDTEKVKEELGIPKDSFVIMLRADNSGFKGLDIIKKALKNIKTKNKITLLTVGENGLLNELKDNKFDIKEYGWISDDKELVKLYQACDLFLMPSKQEAFGMMAIEAMSCGKMVLATEGTALPDVINAPECGIVTPHSAKEYTKELQRLIDNPEIIRERGLKSLEFAKQNYSHDVYVQRIIDVYNNTIENHKIDNRAEFVLEQLQKHTCIKTSQLRELAKKY